MARNILAIGRSPQNDIVLSDERVSSLHARLIRTPDGLLIEDLNSSNGTIVNGEKIKRKQIYSGDRVQFSSTCFLDWNHPAIIEMLGKAQGICSSESCSLSVGRAPENDIVIADGRVSSRHARLTKTTDGLYIEDLVSRNGTFVNGEKISRTKVFVGDRVHFSKNLWLDWNHPAIIGMLRGDTSDQAAASDTFTIGSDPNNDMQIVHHGVESFHAKLRRTPRGLLLESQASEGGTYVEGVKVTSVHIRKGMKVKLGLHCRLNWRDPALRAWLQGSRSPYSFKKRPSLRSVLWFAGAAAVVAFSTFLLLNPPVRSSAVIRPWRTTRIGTDGIVATIPGNAVIEPEEISVAVTQPRHRMTDDVRLETPIYTFSEPRSGFQAPITIDIEYEPPSANTGRVYFPAYWDGDRWVQLFAESDNGVLNVTTDHLSSWAVVSTLQLANPLTSVLQSVTQAVFNPVEISLQSVESSLSLYRDNWELFFFMDDVPTAHTMEATGSPIATVRVGGNTYEIVPTNIPAHGYRTYPGTSSHPAVRDNRGEWVTDPSTQFDVFYAYWSRDFLERIDTNRLADTFQTAADNLQSMYVWHDAANLLDNLQFILIEKLNTGMTGIPPSMLSMIQQAVSQIEGAVCRAEMVRFGLQLEQIASDLRNYSPRSQISEADAMLLMSIEDAFNRIDHLAELSQQTFPAYEENWFRYTANRMFSSLSGRATQALPDVLTSIAPHQAILDPVAMQMAAEMLHTLNDVEEALAILDIVSHVINLSGDNPLYNYYSSTQSFVPSFVNTKLIATDIVYLEPYMGSAVGSGIGISSQPSGATIYFNGMNTGMVTPSSIEDYEPGSHHIRLYLEGYNEYNERFTVEAGRGYSIHGNLQLPTPPLPVISHNLRDGATFTNNVITVSGTVHLEDASGNVTQFQGSSAMLTLNGVDQEIPVNSGSFNQEISIPSGSSTISMRANSHHGDTGVSRTVTVFGDFTIPDIEVTLTWNTPASDIDLHVENPRGEISYYGNEAISDGFLDIDIVNGWGPETFTANNAYTGTYIVSINSFDLKADSYSDASVTIYVRGQLYGTYGPHRFTVEDYNGSNPAAWWEVARVPFQRN